MSAAADTSAFIGGPIVRYGGKGQIAHLLLPHFAKAQYYCEPFFGAGGMFFKVPPGIYAREAVNDLDRSIVTFFRVLRERPEDLARAIEATPFARDEFAACIPRADDDFEEARRVFVRTRQGFSGTFGTVGRWSRNLPGNVSGKWGPSSCDTARANLPVYAARLRSAQIDNIDAVEFIDRWGQSGAFLFCDPPYVHSTRGKDLSYAHEMDDDAHRRFAAAAHGAVARGAHVAVCGYESDLYRELFDGWRTATFDVHLRAASKNKGMRRTECLWKSYPETEELQHVPQLGLFDREGAR